MQLHCMWPKCSTSSAGKGARLTTLICLSDELVASEARAALAVGAGLKEG